MQLNYIFAGFWTLLPIIVAGVVANGVYLGLAFRKEKEKETGTKPREVSLESREGDEKETGAKPSKVSLEPQKGDEKETEAKSSEASEWVTTKLVPVLALIIIICTVVAVTGRAVGFQFNRWWVAASFLGLLAGATFLGFGFMIFSSQKHSISLSLYFFVFFAFSIMYYLGFFARNIYHQIPVGMGGGRPALVRFVVDKEAKPYFDASGVPISEQDNKSEPVELSRTRP